MRSLAKKDRAHLALLLIESLDPGADDVAGHSWLNVSVVLMEKADGENGRE